MRRAVCVAYATRARAREQIKLNARPRRRIVRRITPGDMRPRAKLSVSPPRV